MLNASPHRARGVFAAVCLFALLTPASLFAQVEQARITGTVTDGTGAIVPGVKLTFTHLETNIEHSAETNAFGSYLSVPMRIGEYRVVAEAPGFKRAIRNGVTLRIQETVLLDLVLEVGAVTESIDVTAAAPLLQTTDVSQGQVIDNRKIVDLPLNGRDFLTLAALSSGAFPVTGQKGSTGFSANGMRTELNNYMLDGVDNNMHQQAYTGGQGQAIEPSVDAIQEFKVQTNAYNAEFGNNMGGVVNVTLKSGTNGLHGNLFEFVRNEKFDAKNFFDNPNDDIPPYKQNQFGGTVGGPIVRDKTFFFADYEGRRQRIAGTVLSTVPTALERSGDFSQSVLRGSPVRIYDPNTYDPATKTRQEFANAIIPASAQDPVGVNTANLYPLPNRGGLINNFLFNPVHPLDEDKFDVRIDHNFGTNDTVFGRVSYQWSDWNENFRLPPPAFGGNSNRLDNDSRAYVFGYTHIFSPTVFNTLRLGYTQLLTNRLSPVDDNINKQVGIQGLPFDLAGLAIVNVSNFRGLGTMSGNPNRADSQVRQLKDDVSWLKGQHSLKMGLSLTWPQSPHIHHYQSNGVFTFNGNFTRHTSPNRDGFAMADLIIGYPFRTQLSNRGQSASRRRLYHWYVQDEYKATSKLTLTLGLRYEYNGPWFDKYNGYSNWDIDTDPLNPKLVLARDGGILERALVRPDYQNWAPRFGFAYRVGQKTVVRSGYGIYYGGLDHNGDRYLHASPPFFLQSTISTDSITPVIVMRNGFPAGATTDNVTNLQTISQDIRNRTSYSQQWNFTIQHELANNLSVDIAYIGTKGNMLLIRRDSNAPPPGPGNVNNRRPVTELDVPGVGLVTPLTNTFRREWNGNSIYHGLQLKVEKRYSSGLSFLGAYMWSKAIDDLGQNRPNPWDKTAERALSDNHFPQRFVFSHNYDLPWGRGRKWMTSSGPVANAVLGGWSLGGIWTFSSGRRVNLSVNGRPANTGQNDRPDQLRDAELSKSERTLDRFFDTDAFVRQQDYTFGNAPRNAVVGPGRVNFDIAVFKNFLIGERFDLQFRAEFFNFTNTPPFGNPGSALGTNSFGVISGAGDGRNVQFGLKLGW